MGLFYTQKNKSLWATTLFYMLLIYVLSSISHPPQPVANSYAPMLEHIIEYSILGFLLHTLISSTRDYTKLRVFILAVLLASLYGLTDEIHQFFVSGRVCSLDDLVADTLGSLIGAFISFIRLNPVPDP
ncbi:MAG: VanZ family protein [Candidatus Altiarchaeota archaeon]|nr:VanZ family protein [Candidatus Altiarchaeota archaeon]